ncbi:MAG: ClbS/DfsB family four-helix bundle protein [Peptococcaceae bacterium]|jgi:hypothetical protein|nr:ClbS/DfsB family four-helix bundle protein [Peptococcaceae bacterium]
MPRPRTKPDLIQAANGQFEKMWGMIDSMPDDEQNAIFNFGAGYGKEAHWGRDRNLRDVFVHLYEWHELLLNWVSANQSGEAKPFLPAPYNWETYGDMNVEFWKKHQFTPYEASKEMLRGSHKKVMALIEGFSDEELFVEGRLPWTGGSDLGGSCVSTTSSHYEWAMEKIKAHIKTYGA